MTNLSNLKNEIKLESVKTFFAVTMILLLGWGVSSSAVDDIKSATANFNVIGTVSEISSNEISLKDAKGSNKTGDTSYDLNIEYLNKIETSAYVPLNLSDIKVGDKIIAQGLTNNSTFFIKRIISFDSIATPVEEKDIATSTATTTPMDDIVIATTTDVGTSTLTEDVIDLSTGGSASETAPIVSTEPTPVTTPTPTSTPTLESTSTDVVSTTTSTSTDETSTSTDSIVDVITSTVEDVIDAVTDAVQTVIDTVMGSSTPEVVNIPSVETPAQDVPVQNLIDNSIPVN